jgi:enoyl-CoA hydratase
MSEPALLVSRDGAVLTVAMNRPSQKNAINPEMLCRLADAWDTLDNDDSLSVAILTGSGGVFCAGADLDKLVTRSLKNLPPEDEFEQRIRDNYELIFKGLLRSYRTKKPLIAAIEGDCIAGGVEILQGTDIRVAGDSARLGISEVRWSLFPQGGSTTRLVRQIPYTAAMEMLLTGSHYPASKALEWGLVGHVVPAGQALTKAREIAAVIAANGPIAVRKIKEAVLASECIPDQDARKLEMEIGMQVFSTEDAKEGPRAFKEKRKPVYKGR